MYIHIGALIGTIMAANVFLVIMPSQRALVSAVTEGTTPDPSWGAKAKLRSTHNTYTVLPLLFIMISNHYPMTYNHQYGWLVLVCLFIITALVRWYFVLKHTQKPSVLIPIVVVIMTLSLAYLMSDRLIKCLSWRRSALSWMTTIVCFAGAPEFMRAQLQVTACLY